MDTGCLVAFQPSVDYDIQFVGGFTNALFGGEGLFLATLRGPGRVYLQTLPFSRLADRIKAAVDRNRGQHRGVAGLGGGLLKDIISGDWIVFGDYDDAYRTAGWFGTEPSRLLTDHLDLLPAGARVLDIGMGQGRHALPLARRGCRVTGIDTSSVAVQTVADVAAAEDLPVAALRQDYRALPDPERPWDAILCFGLLPMLPVAEVGPPDRTPAPLGGPGRPAVPHRPGTRTTPPSPPCPNPGCPPAPGPSTTRTRTATASSCTRTRSSTCSPAGRWSPTGRDWASPIATGMARWSARPGGGPLPPARRAAWWTCPRSFTAERHFSPPECGPSC